LENYDSLLESACSKINGLKLLEEKTDASSSFFDGWDGIAITRTVHSGGSILTTYAAYTTEENLLKMLGTTATISLTKSWFWYHCESLITLLQSLVGSPECINQIIDIEVDHDLFTMRRSVLVKFQTLQPDLSIHGTRFGL
jgi:hypothetical protein